MSHGRPEADGNTSSISTTKCRSPVFERRMKATPNRKPAGVVGGSHRRVAVAGLSSTVVTTSTIIISPSVSVSLKPRDYLSRAKNVICLIYGGLPERLIRRVVMVYRVADAW